MAERAKQVCVIAGAGAGNGAAFARRFAAAGYRCALLARSTGAISRIAREVPGSLAISCDTGSASSVAGAFRRIRHELGPPTTLIYNAAARRFADLDGTTPEVFEEAWRTGTLGAFLCSREAVPGMRAAGSGNLVFVGATASLRGGAGFLAFASAKAALRSLAQSLARDLGPQGIHVSHLVVDGVIDMPLTRERMPDRPDALFMAPDAIAEAAFQVTLQPRTAWTFELDLRPAAERW